uniref:Uncharacterized protein n=1 Tax=Solibacter usitatus (strain Ellin6076) TaxID=234267 RepID=Q021G5_SOLUE
MDHGQQMLQAFSTRAQFRDQQFTGVCFRSSGTFRYALLARSLRRLWYRCCFRHQWLPSELPSKSKLRASFVLPVHFHGVRRFSGHPTHGQGLAAQQAHAQRFDMFGVTALIGIDGAT